MEMNMEALKVIQKRFYTDFPPHEKEKVYKFATPSTMKPTKWSCKANLNLFRVCLAWLCSTPEQLYSKTLGGAALLQSLDCFS